MPIAGATPNAYENQVGREHLAASLALLFYKDASSSSHTSILSADLHTAFDTVGPWTVLKALKFWDLPPDIDAAVLRELVGHVGRLRN